MNRNTSLAFRCKPSRRCLGVVLWILALTTFLTPDIALAAVEGGPCTPEPTDMVIAYGDLVICSIDPADVADIFRFQGQTGELVSVVASRQSAPGVPCIELYFGATRIAGPVCGTAGARIDFKLTATGSHTILVTEQFNDQDVGYALSLERLVPPLNSAAEIQYAHNVPDEINTIGDVDLYRLNGSAGTTVTIIVSRDSGAGVPCVELWEPGTSSRIGGPVCGTAGARIDATLSVTGIHTILLSEQFSDQTVSYTIDLQCVSGPCPTSDLLTKVGVFRNGAWFLDNGKDGRVRFDNCGSSSPQDNCGAFGLPGDIPVVGDWDGSGKVKVGVFRNGAWYLDNGNQQWDGCGVFPAQDRCGAFGVAGDRPVVGDWDGSGRTKVGVFRNGAWYLDNGNLQWDGCDDKFLGRDLCGNFGLPIDQPVVGRWSVFP